MIWRSRFDRRRKDTAVRRRNGILRRQMKTCWWNEARTRVVELEVTAGATATYAVHGRVVTEGNNAINAGGEYRYLFGAGAAVGYWKEGRGPDRWRISRYDQVRRHVGRVRNEITGGAEEAAQIEYVDRWI